MIRTTITRQASSRLRRRHARPSAREVAGICGAAYVMGGLDPKYDSPRERDAQVRRFLRSGSAGPDAAASFLAGWSIHR